MTTKDPEILKLVEIAKHELPKDKATALPPVKRFMVTDGVESGNEWIPGILIYDRYVKWATVTNLPILTIVPFFQELVLYADKKYTNDGVFYKLSPKGFNLSPEYLKMVTTARRISRENKKVKKKK